MSNETKSSGLTVKIAYPCSRKQKSIDLEVPLETAHEMAQRLTEKSEQGEVVGNFLAELDPKPDCVVMFRGKVVVLSNVHHSNDEAMKRAFNMALGKEEFAVPAPQTRKAKTKEPLVEETAE